MYSQLNNSINQYIHLDPGQKAGVKTNKYLKDSTKVIKVFEPPNIFVFIFKCFFSSIGRAGIL